MKMKNLLTKGLILTAILNLFVIFSFAQKNAPFYGNGYPCNPQNTIDYVQTDGNVVTMNLYGDAVVNWAKSIDGYTLVKNNEGTWTYAKSTFDGALLPSEFVAKNPENRTQQEIDFLTQTPKNIFYTQEQIQRIKENTWMGKLATEKMGGFPTTGTRKMLMILANFSNTSTTYTQTNFDNYMNQVNYNSTGSFRDYYLENSYGQLTVNTTVTVWVKVPNTHDYYGPESKWAEFIRDAVNAADAAGVDFSQFDNDGDGYVDGIAVIHQGVGQEESGNTKDIWSHNWSLSSGGFNVTKDGKKIDAYTCQPEKSGSSIATIGVMCHEFGHNLGAPDYYDTNYSTNGQYEGTGYWDMMCSGSYNGSPSGAKPAHHNPYTKAYTYGWLTPVTISSAASISMTNVEENKVVYRYNTTTTNEYFLIENRQKIGFDATLPGKGLLIYHVDGSYITSHMNANDINATSHQGLYIKNAGGSHNSASSPFPGSGSKTSFTDATTPNSKSWAGANTSKPITNIAENTTTKIITFDFMGGSVTPTAPTATTNAATTGETTATLNGTVNNNNAASTTVTFEYGLTTSYGSSVNASPNSVTGATATAVTANLTGLSANTTYNYRVKAVNSVGTTYGSNMTFTTTASASAVNLPYSQNFGSTMATGWTTQNEGTGITERWSCSNTANAGGTAYEMKCTYQSINPGTSRLITPKLNTVGMSSITLSYKYMYDAYGTGITLKVQTSTNGTTWTDVWSVAGTATNIAATTNTVNITTNLNSTNTQIAFVVTGNLYQMDYLYIDNVSIVSGGGSTPVVPTVTTTAASSVTTSTAITGGNVTADGGASITARGVCYATTTNPTTANSIVTATGTTGAFTCNLSGLSANTTYYVRAYATNSVGTSYGSQVSFTTATPITYCTSKGNSINYEWIDLVQLGSINRTSGADGGYIDNTNLSTNIGRGYTYTISFSAGFKSTAYTEYWKIYIDYNQDGDFTDSGETVVSTSSSSSSTLSASFTVPSTATLGTTRMRVVMSDNSSTTSCNTYSYGETEDYTVNIGTTQSAPNMNSVFAFESNEMENFTIYPNPVKDILNIHLLTDQRATIEIYTITGIKVISTIVDEYNSEINISDMDCGTYMMLINDGQKVINKKFIKY